MFKFYEVPINMKEFTICLLLLTKLQSMASLDLDPIFVKGLKLLHSKSKDSADQLRQMIDDLIAQKKGLHKGKVTKNGFEKIPMCNLKHSNIIFIKSIFWCSV